VPAYPGCHRKEAVKRVSCPAELRACFSVMYCPNLTPPDNGELSTMDVVYNTVVTVTCNTGFKMPDDRLHKSLTCLDVNGAVLWNDTVTHCQRTDKRLLESDSVTSCRSLGVTLARPGLSRGLKARVVHGSEPPATARTTCREIRLNPMTLSWYFNG